MKNKDKMRINHEGKVYIDDELSKRGMEIQRHIRIRATDERKQVKVEFKKITK